MFESVKAKLRELEAECERLKVENIWLRAQLLDRSTNAASGNEAASDGVSSLEETNISNSSSPEAKVKLFTSLFRGRTDIYAERWEGKGKSGYSPVFVRKWGEVIAKEDREYLPVTDNVIQAHLRGEMTMGCYPILSDDRCLFLVADFDKKSWQSDCEAFLNVCDSIGIPCSLECSRSGNGGHVWIFFEQPIECSLARKLGSGILTKAMESQPGMGLDSYDRLFPSQDFLPTGGFGNLIALPLQKKAREVGGSLFLDRNFNSFTDQWAYLSTVKKVLGYQIEDTVLKLEAEGDILGTRRSFDPNADSEKPWDLKPSEHFCHAALKEDAPATITVVRSNLLYIDTEGVGPSLLNRIVRIAAFHNPEFYKAQALRFSTYDKPRLVHCAEEITKYLALPRGCLNDLETLCETHGVDVELKDERNLGRPLDLSFRGELRNDQKAAVRGVMKYDDGIICAATAFGKTVVAANIISKRKTNTLIIVHRRQLLDQWKDRLVSFLDLDPKDIGQIGGGKSKPTGKVDIAVVQTLNRRGVVKDLVAEYGHVIVDECHHISAISFEQVMKQVKAKYVLGLTATPERKDGHHPILFMQCGPIRYRMTAKQQSKLRPFRYVVHPISTGIRFDYFSGQPAIHELYKSLVLDPDRNRLIQRQVSDVIRAGRNPLVLTERTEHVDLLARLLDAMADHVVVLKGGMGVKQRRELKLRIESIKESESRVIVATGSYIGEGFDDSRLDTLFLAMPISWKGTLQQYVGRLHRLHEGKKEVRVYDYVDDDSPMFASMFRKRLKGYSSMGYEIDDTVQGRLEL